MSKVRRIDFYPDEFIAGITGQMLPEDIGVYWTVCSLIYSSGGPIKNDPRRLSLVMGGAHVRTIKAALKRLHDSGKITCSDAELSVKRCLTELEKTGLRIAKNAANGAIGGKKSNKNNETTQANAYPVASTDAQAKNRPTREPPTSNQQPATTNHHGTSAPPDKVSDDDFPEMPAFLDRRPKPVDNQPPDTPRGTPATDPFQQAILDGTALHPEDSSQPTAIGRMWDQVRDLADTAKRLGFTPDALKALLTEKRVEMVEKGDPVTSIKFYTATVERAAQRRNVETAGGSGGGADTNPDRSLQRLMRVRTFASNGLWQQAYGPEPSQELQDVATAWRSSDPVPELFQVKQEGRS